jgi:hypothetical protein
VPLAAAARVGVAAVPTADAAADAAADGAALPEGLAAAEGAVEAAVADGAAEAAGALLAAGAEVGVTLPPHAASNETAPRASPPISKRRRVKVDWCSGDDIRFDPPNW